MHFSYHILLYWFKYLESSKVWSYSPSQNKLITWPVEFTPLLLSRVSILLPYGTFNHHLHHAGIQLVEEMLVSWGNEWWNNHSGDFVLFFVFVHSIGLILFINYQHLTFYKPLWQHCRSPWNHSDYLEHMRASQLRNVAC